MSGSGALKRSQHVAIRCARLRDEGHTISEIAAMTGVDRSQVPSRIDLGRRLIDSQKQGGDQ